jgi:hypothetical protein
VEILIVSCFFHLVSLVDPGLIQNPDNVERAIKEIEFLFDAQWKNGMVPSIVFNEKEKTYFPSADFYEITRSDNTPTHIGTSGMTQPAVHAISCYYIYKNSDDNNNKAKAKEFLNKIYPKLKAFHRLDLYMFLIQANFFNCIIYFLVSIGSI